MKKERYDIEFVLGNASQRSLWRMLTEQQHYKSGLQTK